MAVTSAIHVCVSGSSVICCPVYSFGERPRRPHSELGQSLPACQHFQMYFNQIINFLCRVLLWRCKLGVLQYTVVRPVTTVIAL